MSELGKERILRTAVRPKKEKKGLLDKYLINGPPSVGVNIYVCVCVLGFRFQGVVVITRYQSLLLPPGKVLPVCVTQ